MVSATAEASIERHEEPALDTHPRLVKLANSSKKAPRLASAGPAPNPPRGPFSPTEAAEMRVDLLGEYRALMRRTPVERAIELRDKFGVPVPAIAAACPVPAKARFVDREKPPLCRFKLSTGI